MRVSCRRKRNLRGLLAVGLECNEIRRYNKDSYPVSETFDADGPAPITFTYDRDETTNVVRSATMSCIGPDGRVTRTVPPAANRDDEMKQSLMRETCVPGR